MSSTKSKNKPKPTSKDTVDYGSKMPSKTKKTKK
jgi:hypothetical protein